MRFTKKIFLFALFANALVSCDLFTNKMCGELGQKEKEEISALEARYPFRIETITCEYRYTNVIVKENYNDTLLYSLHKDILNSNILNYSSIKVYNEQKEKLFEQYYNSYKETFSRTKLEP